MAPLMIMPMILFGGLFANNSSVGEWISWIQYISPIKYAAESMVHNEFQPDPFGVKDNFTSFLDYNLGYWKCILILIALMIGFRILALYTFKALVTKFQ
mmetsp:Transcript_21771/g.33626  ORF Transcript_21771/g.33626 Transcript_21771/m.33626 type:complete len:99 (+) Transcript_21771:277-573(+)